MKDCPISNLTWIALKVYSRTFGVVPALLIDIDIQDKPRQVQLVITRHNIPGIVVNVVGTVFLLVGITFLLTKKFFLGDKMKLHILTIAISLILLIFLGFWLVSAWVIFRTWHGIPFINDMIANRLSRRKEK